MPDPLENISLIKGLDQLTPGRLPQPVFEAVARLVVTPTFVVVPVFRQKGKTRVILTRRDVNDTQYAGMLHPPGKILLASDKDLQAVFARLVLSELTNMEIHSAPVFVENFFDEITRGHEISMVHYLEVGVSKYNGLSYDPNDLPTDVIPNDIPRILSAVSAFDDISENETSNANHLTPK